MTIHPQLPNITAFHADMLQTQARMEQAKIRCLMVGCSDRELDLHQRVVRELAISHLLFRNGAVVEAGLELLYRNLAAGRSPFPTTATDDSKRLSIQVWAHYLWEIVSGDKGKHWSDRLAVQLQDQYVAWVNTAQKIWTEQIEESQQAI